MSPGFVTADRDVGVSQIAYIFFLVFGFQSHKN